MAGSNSSRDDIFSFIKNSIPISTVVERFVPLEGKGNDKVACCPFHAEDTPSFHVRDEEGYFKCFGGSCGESGDVIKFVEKIKGITPIEACKYIATEFNIDIPDKYQEFMGKKKPKDPKTEENLKILSEAVEFYIDQLVELGTGRGARYLESRGIGAYTALAFQMGYAPEASYEEPGALYTHLKAGHSDTALLESGLVHQDKNGRFYDVFRDRIMFPIKNDSGETVGFGGRAIDKQEPAKYVNSAASKLFNKSRLLFGFDKFLEYKKDKYKEDRKSGDDVFIIIVEGYLDVVSLYEADVKNAVATLGTAITEGHAALLAKHRVDNVIICYDSDNPGIVAAQRAVDILKNRIKNVKVCQLGEGLDPDEYIRKYGRAAFEKKLSEAKYGVEYKIDKIAENFNLNEADGRVAFQDKAIAEINSVDNLVQRFEFKRYLTEAYGVDELLLEHAIDKQEKKAPAAGGGSNGYEPDYESEYASNFDADYEEYLSGYDEYIGGTAPPIESAESRAKRDQKLMEELLLKRFIMDHQDIMEDEELQGSYMGYEFENKDLSTIFSGLMLFFLEGEAEFEPDALKGMVDDDKVEMLRDIYEMPLEPRDAKSMILSCEVAKLKRYLDDNREKLDSIEKYNLNKEIMDKERLIKTSNGRK